MKTKPVLFSFRGKPLGDQIGYRVFANTDDLPLSRVEALELLVADEGFRGAFLDALTDHPYRAYRFETPPLSASTRNRPFEFVVIDSPGIELPADRSPFAEQFAAAAPGGICEFENLGGDALMVVPAPLNDSSSYSHIGEFHRSAPRTQQHALWAAAASATLDSIGEEPLWLNTAGGGVAWLHVRLDSRPKYYVYAPYRDSNA